MHDRYEVAHGFRSPKAGRATAAISRIVDALLAWDFPEHEHEQFLAHFRGLVGMWVDDQR